VVKDRRIIVDSRAVDTHKGTYYKGTPLAARERRERLNETETENGKTETRTEIF